MQLTLAVLSGDGIGPEVTAEAVKVLNATAVRFGHQFDIETGLIGAIAIDETGTALPDATLKLCQRADAVLFGAIGDPKYDNDPAATVRPEQGLLALRKALGLFANVRPVKAYEALLDKSPLKNAIIDGTDIVMYRELTGGIYFGDKQRNDTQAKDVCAYHADEITRVARLAFRAAQLRRKKLTLVDKANVLDTSRLWRSVVTDLHATDYADVELDFLFVDNAAMQLILNPRQFDVVLTENMFGDILSDEASVIGGSIGLLASASLGEKACLFEPIHGSYPQATGQGIANPIAAILSVAMLLTHHGLRDEASAIERAVSAALDEGKLTPDLNQHSPLTTAEVGDFIVSQLSV